MRILITGGAGFLGSHLCERLLAAGNEVICLDNFFTGRKENIIHLLDDKNFELVRHDVTEPILLEVDQIYNMACPASPVHYQYNPVKTVKTSVMGAINMRLAKASKARIFRHQLRKFRRSESIRKQKITGEMSCMDSYDTMKAKRRSPKLFEDSIGRTG